MAKRGCRRIRRALLVASLSALAPGLWAQQVDDKLAYAYLASPAYPYDIQLGELFLPGKQTNAANTIYRLSQEFWRDILENSSLGDAVAPLSLHLLQLQFSNYLQQGVRPAGLATIRSAVPLVGSDSAQIQSKLIFEDKTYLLVTLYFLRNDTPSDKAKNAKTPDWLIEAADFHPTKRQSVPGGYNYEPRSDHYLRGVG